MDSKTKHYKGSSLYVVTRYVNSIMFNQILCTICRMCISGTNCSNLYNLLVVTQQIKICLKAFSSTLTMFTLTWLI